MALDFPNSPNHGDEFTSGGRTWVYDSAVPAWKAKVVGHAASHATGGSDELTPADLGLGSAATLDSSTGGNGAADAGKVVEYCASGQIKCGTGGEITLAANVTTEAFGYISTGTNAPIFTAGESNPGVSGDGGYISTGQGGHINTTAGGSITTGTGHLTGPAASGTIALTSNADGALNITSSTTSDGTASLWVNELTNEDGTSLIRPGVDHTGTGGFNTGVAEGDGSVASGDSSHAEGSSTTASGNYSHAEGYSTTASGGASHAEGDSTTASGVGSHAEGSSTTASGNYSHAEGYSTTASGFYSHAEGAFTIASGSSSHAEGDSTTASGNYSHAGGRRAKAIHSGTFVRTDSQAANCESTAADQATFRFLNGYRFLGGAADFQTTPTVNSSAIALASDIPTQASDIGAVATTGDETVDGNKSFSGQTELTNQAATNATSAMTRYLTRLEPLWNIAAIRGSDHASYGTGGSGASASQNDGDNLQSGTTAGAKAWARRYRATSRIGPISGASAIATVPIAISSLCAGFHPGSINADGRIRCLVGMLETSGGPAGEADALSGRGFGWEIYYSSGNARTEIRLVAHDGTSFSASAGIAFNVTAIDSTWTAIVTHDGAGNLALYATTGYASRPSSTPIATLTAANLGTSTYANGGYVNWQMANHSSNTPTSQMVVKVLDRKFAFTA